ncbi:hypothetical protein Q9290_14835 [Oceanimonas sp. CHS3-5]|uniref:hypothetical protein n=1 Tax=Oceanimonas sp. CHS3-5 TaxID=3068186 RepID=UPI00273F2082|nr:hypothetical protein [Oceanimonas sp. CHS3-5]MDP5293557.1 hypothetical protein [Oceanimonas sp. CHS3-5]
MAAFIKERISALPANNQPDLLKCLDMMESAPTQVSELVEILCAGEPMFPGPSRSLLLEVAGAEELMSLATRLTDITDSSTRESIYRVIEVGVHRVKPLVAAKIYTLVATSLCTDIAEFDSGKGVQKLTVVAGVTATVTSCICARGAVKQPENQCLLSDELKSELFESIKNRELWVESGSEDPWKFWGVLGALLASEKVNWLVKPRG